MIIIIHTILDKISIYNVSLNEVLIIRVSMDPHGIVDNLVRIRLTQHNSFDVRVETVLYHILLFDI